MPLSVCLAHWRKRGNLPFAVGVAGEAHTQLAEYFAVHLVEHHGAVHLAAFKLWKNFQRMAAVFILGAEHRERHKHLIGVQSWVSATQILDFGVLNWFNQALWNQLLAMVDACQVLGGVENERRTRSEQVALLRGDDGAVEQFDGGGRHTERLFAGAATVVLR